MPLMEVTIFPNAIAYHHTDSHVKYIALHGEALKILNEFFLISPS